MARLRRIEWNTRRTRWIMKDAIKLIDKLYPVLLIGFLLWYNYDSVDHRDLKTRHRVHSHHRLTPLFLSREIGTST